MEHSLDHKGICWYRQNQSPPPDYSWKHDSILKHTKLPCSLISLLNLQIDGLWFIWIVMRDFFLPCHTKQGESYRVFDEQCVVLCRHQQGRSWQQSKQENDFNTFNPSRFEPSMLSVSLQYELFSVGTYSGMLWSFSMGHQASTSHVLVLFTHTPVISPSNKCRKHSFAYFHQANRLKVELYLCLYV